MKIETTALEGVLVVIPDIFSDDRGWFSELWNQERYELAGIEGSLRQENVSRSRYGVLRGMHYQHPRAQAKLVSVLQGSVYDVAIDIRHGSPTFGAWVGQILSVENHKQLYVPAGLAHGFLVLSEEALVHYSCSDLYDPRSDRSIAWDDPDIGVLWPSQPDILSVKDRIAPRLRDVPAHALPSLHPHESP